ncbi:NUDIX domain-containing protein [Roseimicrobium sp. ORNL1]|uniref:NUDIX hydrolase n=1 Tax=Roseimicrobium sp. ORNL1 TaxID=2711231 RepID=UPI0013E1BB2B|nr:NUDIX domain-containing protein [Roseimicrobium sp. ORNL1]QIF00223.1 NUDIX hydrolase [Roseimicrobium sp. ORNL1]
MSFAYKYARPALTVDCVIFGFASEEHELRVLLIQRGLPPFEGRWALPGGFVKVGESTDVAARRELEEETGLKQVYLEQFKTFSDPKRDPREHVVSVAYYALVPFLSHPPKADTDAKDAAWFSVEDVPSLAFDHKLILETALHRLRLKMQHEPVGFELLPPQFTLTQLQQVYEAVLGQTLDKRNFRKKILSMNLLIDTGEVQQDVAHRAAALWKFDARRYEKLKKGGFHFAL